MGLKYEPSSQRATREHAILAGFDAVRILQTRAAVLAESQARSGQSEDLEEEAAAVLVEQREDEAGHAAGHAAGQAAGHAAGQEAGHAASHAVGQEAAVGAGERERASEREQVIEIESESERGAHAYGHPACSGDALRDHRQDLGSGAAASSGGSESGRGSRAPEVQPRPGCNPEANGGFL